jgi:hypothetical protein
MSTTTQYIGERYVPIVADPVEWNANREYEHLTIVMYNGDSYISKQDVPKGAQIANTRYWLKTNDFNAQLDQATRQANAATNLANSGIEKANQAMTKADSALEKFPVSIANGGTGKTTASEAWTALGGGSIGKKNALSASDIPSGIDVSKITGTLDVAHGGTGVTTAQAERNRLGLGNTTDALPVANGGTGSTNATAARTALDAAQSGGAAGTLYAAEQSISTLNTKMNNTYKIKTAEYEIGDFNNLHEYQQSSKNIAIAGYTPVSALGLCIQTGGGAFNAYVICNLTGTDLKILLVNPSPAPSSSSSILLKAKVKVFYVPNDRVGS